MTVIVNVVNGNYRHTLDVSVVSQSRANNTTTVSYVYNIHRNVGSGSGAWVSSGGRSFRATVNGTNDTETKNFDFRTVADLTAASGTLVIAHGSDDTKSITASINGPTEFVSSGFPETSGSGSLALPRIIRNRAKVGVAGAWVDAEVYVRINGAWVAARPFAGVAGAWKELAA